MEKIVLRISLFAVVVILASCLREPNLKLPFTTFVPVNLNDGWEISTPSAEGIDEAELRKIYEYFHESPDLWQVRSLLVFRNNRLVAESYTKNPAEITELVPIWSCTKQIIGILAGIAIDKGYIDDINDPIQKYLPSEIARFPDKGAITIRNLLQMQSGIAFFNDGFKGGAHSLLLQIPSNSVDFILGKPMHFPQGERFHYNDGDPHLISAIIQRQTSKTTRDWADEVLFSKINFKNYTWAVYKDGVTLGGNGISTTPREMARIGQLVLNNGYWNGVQIISSEWINEMTSVKIPENQVNFANVAHTSFGYQWWINESRGVVFMGGRGGQFVFVKPSKNLVVVTTADPTDSSDHAFSLGSALRIFDRIDRISN